MTEEKSLIELRKEAKSLGIEEVNAMDRTKLKTAIEAKEKEAKANEPDPELDALREFATSLGIEGAETMTLEELEASLSKTEEPVAEDEKQDTSSVTEEPSAELRPPVEEPVVDEEKQDDSPKPAPVIYPEVAKEVPPPPPPVQTQEQILKSKEQKLIRYRAYQAKYDKLIETIREAELVIKQARTDLSEVSVQLETFNVQIPLIEQLAMQKKIEAKTKSNRLEFLLKELAALKT